MPLKYKMDVIAELKKAGYSTYRIRQEKLITEVSLQKIRKNKPVSWATIAKICTLLKCQPGDILEHAGDDTP